MSLYAVDLIQTSTLEFQLCFGVSWLGVMDDSAGMSLMADLQAKGLSLLCSSAFHSDSFDVRPYPSFYVCVPAEVGDGSLLLTQVAVREHVRCVDRPDPQFPRDARLSEWVLRHWSPKAFSPVDYSNHFFEYTAAQCISGSRPTQGVQRVETKPPKSLSTLDRLSSMFESASLARKGKKPAGKSG